MWDELTPKLKPKVEQQEGDVASASLAQTPPAQVLLRVDVHDRRSSWFEVRVPGHWDLNYAAEALVQDLILAARAKNMTEAHPRKVGRGRNRRAIGDDHGVVVSDHFTHLVFPDGRWFTNDFAIDASCENHTVHLGSRASSLRVNQLGLAPGETFSVEYERGLPREATASATFLAAAAEPGKRPGRAATETAHGLFIARMGLSSWWNRVAPAILGGVRPAAKGGRGGGHPSHVKMVKKKKARATRVWPIFSTVRTGSMGKSEVRAKRSLVDSLDGVAAPENADPPRGAVQNLPELCIDIPDMHSSTDANTDYSSKEDEEESAL